MLRDGRAWHASLSGRLLGFATVTAGHIEIENLPKAKRKKLPMFLPLRSVPKA
jgi:hypothetical protein